MSDIEKGLPHMKQETAGKGVKVHEQVEEVKGIMNKNVQDAMSRGEQLNDLEAKTAALEEGSRAFAKNSKQVSSNIWWKNMKYIAIIVGIVVLLILIIVMSIFGRDIIGSMFSSTSSRS